MRRTCAALLIAACVTSAAAAETTPKPDPALPSYAVAAVIDGDTITLADGRDLRLVGIQAPKLPLGREDFAAWPLAQEAKAFVQSLLAEPSVRLLYGGRREDRHGRILAHGFTADGRWIQGAVLSAGYARVYSFADNRALVQQMLDLERAARRQRLGIWAKPFYAVRDVTETPYLLDSFQLVEDQVREAASVRGVVYLNFGDDWRRDFTIRISRRDARSFAAMGLDPAAWGGRRLRVRGWLKQWNGPMIEVSHPEQIELLE